MWRKLLRKPLILMLPLTLAALGAGSCGGGEEATPTPRATVAPQPTATTAAAPRATPGPTATAALGAPAPTATPRPAPTATAAALTGGTLRIAFASFGIESFIPSKSTLTGGRLIGGPMYDWMGWLNKDGSLAPGVVQRWEVAPDAMSWTLQIRSDMRFHNGDALTAEDIKFSFEQVVRPEATANSASLWRSLAPSVTVISPTSVRVASKTPWPLLNYDIGPVQGGEGAVVPKTYTERVGEKGFEEKPVGTGPWRFVQQRPGVSFSFDAVKTKHPYRATPQYERLEFLLVPEESTRVAMLQTGVLEISQASYEQAFRFQKGTTLKVLTIAQSALANIHFWGWGDPRIEGMPLGNRDVRRALTKAVNTKEIVDQLFSGLAEVAARNAVVPGTLGWNDAWKPEPYDPAGARELLAKAGYSRGFSIEFYSFSSPITPWLPRVVEAVAGYWSQIGVTPKIIPIDYSVMLNMFRATPQSADLVGRASGLQGQPQPTNIVSLRVIYHSKGTLRLAKSNQVDAWIDEALATTSSERRVELIRQIIDFTHSEAITIPLVSASGVFLATAKVRSWEIPPFAVASQFLETVVPAP